ncbi:hypothetical protein PtrCC142_005258 [Pyrenophora tritici-repentis]|nr:hypothetical protein PtrSN001A_005587 [Pyrenophora tritici-repentis]KAI1539006.1 hypothetical protein PtrSN001C_005493 [Pyrenophora tritici-repentis]KAI1570009.1 hypothetical protein PtrEW4_005581 [Pyrenophora tritici-repentis]KAI1579305.1 hypothetical protein PtrEW7m1_005349 [Pyrenophora tritici-repentis]KAI1602583.1 hypothetical protein PtrCC142_005258 [Pyrenophora tritici-repentis]
MAQPATSDQPSTEQAHLNAWLKRNLCSVETGIQQDNAQVTCNISVKDYLAINNLRPEDDENWLDDTAIDFALAVLTNKHNRQSGNDVGVLPMYQGTELYNWGKGAKEAEAEHQQRRPLVESTPKEKRYIVVPVSDGVLDKAKEEAEKTREELKKAEDEGAKEAKEEELEKAKERVAENYKRAKEAKEAANKAKEAANKAKEAANKAKEAAKKAKGGAEATQQTEGTKENSPVQRTARWFDGLLDLERSRSHADKYRIRQMLRPGEVAGKILCGIEQLLGDERGRFDAKTAKYVPHQTRDNAFKGDHGACGPYVIAFLEYLYNNPTYLRHLRSSFRIENSDRNKRDMGFHSLCTRVDMQEWIRHECEKSQQDDELPLKMTSDVFRILRPKALGPLLATAYRAFDGRADPVNFDAFEFKPHGNHRSRRGGSGSGGKPDDDTDIDNTDDEDRNDDVFRYDPDDPDATFSKIILGQELRGNKQAYLGVKPKEQRYRRAYETLVERQKTHDNLSKIPKRKYRSLLNLPTGISALPTDFGDEEVVSAEQLEAWKEANAEALERMELGPQAKKATDISFRAALHVLSAVEFADEKDDRIVDFWLNDPEVFNDRDRNDPSLKLQPNIIKDRLRNKYERGIERSGENTDNSGADQPRISIGPPVPPKTRQPPNPFNVVTYPDFASIKASGTNFRTYVAENDALFKDTDRGNDESAQRAVLWRTYKGSFTKSSAVKVWRKDEYVFAPEDRKLSLGGEAIRQRMDDIYWNLNPQPFISITDIEVRLWTQNLPQAVRDRMLNEDGRLDIDLARGRLHRLFVGEFVELIRPGEQHAEKNRGLLAVWRREYGEKYGQKFKNDEEAVDAKSTSLATKGLS